MVNSCIRQVHGNIQDVCFFKLRNHTISWHTCTPSLLQIWIWSPIRFFSFTVVVARWKTLSKKAKADLTLLLSAVIPSSKCQPNEDSHVCVQLIQLVQATVASYKYAKATGRYHSFKADKDCCEGSPFSKKYYIQTVQ